MKKYRPLPSLELRPSTSGTPEFQESPSKSVKKERLHGNATGTSEALWVSGASALASSSGSPSQPTAEAASNRKRGASTTFQEDTRAVTPVYGQQLWDNGTNSCWLTSVLAVLSLLRARIGKNFPPKETFTPVFQSVVDNLMPWIPGSADIAGVTTGEDAFQARNYRRNQLKNSLTAHWTGGQGHEYEYGSVKTMLATLTQATQQVIKERVSLGTTSIPEPTLEQVAATRAFLLPERRITSKCDTCFISGVKVRNNELMIKFAQYEHIGYETLAQNELFGTPTTGRAIGSKKCKNIVSTESPYQRNGILKKQCTGRVQFSIESMPPTILPFILSCSTWHGGFQYTEPMTLHFDNKPVRYWFSALIVSPRKEGHFRSRLYDGVHLWSYDSLVKPYMTVLDTTELTLDKDSECIFYIREDMLDSDFNENMKKFRKKQENRTPVKMKKAKK